MTMDSAITFISWRGAGISADIAPHTEQVQYFIPTRKTFERPESKKWYGDLVVACFSTMRCTQTFSVIWPSRDYSHFVMFRIQGNNNRKFALFNVVSSDSVFPLPRVRIELVWFTRKPFSVQPVENIIEVNLPIQMIKIRVESWHLPNPAFIRKGRHNDPPNFRGGKRWRNFSSSFWGIMLVDDPFRLSCHIVKSVAALCQYIFLTSVVKSDTLVRKAGESDSICVAPNPGYKSRF